MMATLGEYITFLKADAEKLYEELVSDHPDIEKACSHALHVEARINYLFKMWGKSSITTSDG